MKTRSAESRGSARVNTLHNRSEERFAKLKKERASNRSKAKEKQSSPKKAKIVSSSSEDEHESDASSEYGAEAYVGKSRIKGHVVYGGSPSKSKYNNFTKAFNSYCTDRVDPCEEVDSESDMDFINDDDPGVVEEDSSEEGSSEDESETDASEEETETKKAKTSKSPKKRRSVVESDSEEEPGQGKDEANTSMASKNADASVDTSDLSPVKIVRGSKLVLDSDDEEVEREAAAAGAESSSDEEEAPGAESRASLVASTNRILSASTPRQAPSLRSSVRSTQATASTNGTGGSGQSSPRRNLPEASSAADLSYQSPYSDTNLYIRGLNPDVTERDLILMCREFGNMVSQKVIRDHYTGASRGFGFVNFERAQDAAVAVAALNKRGFDAQMARAKKPEFVPPPKRSLSPDTGESEYSTDGHDSEADDSGVEDEEGSSSEEEQLLTESFYDADSEEGKRKHSVRAAIMASKQVAEKAKFRSLLEKRADAKRRKEREEKERREAENEMVAAKRKSKGKRKNGGRKRKRAKRSAE